MFEPIDDPVFIPKPNLSHYSNSDINPMAAKPAGPHIVAPQFSYRKESKSEIDPFQESSTVMDAQNSPHFNLQK